MTRRVAVTLLSSPSATSMAAVVTREFAAEAEIDDDATARLQSAVACFVDYCRTCSYPDRTDGEIMLALELDASGIRVTASDRGRPARRAGGSFGPLPPGLAAAGELDPLATLDNLAEEGKRLELHVACAHGWRADEAGKPTRRTADAHTRDEIALRVATADDADAITQLLYDTYGLDYVHDEFYRPLLIGIAMQRGILTSVVAYAGDELVGHIALGVMGPGESAEALAAVIAEDWRGLWLYNDLHDFALAHARGMGLPALYGQSTTAHVVSQRLGIGSGYKPTALLVGGAPPSMGEAQRAHHSASSARGALLYAVLPLAASPVLTAALPAQYADVLRQIANDAGYAIVDPSKVEPLEVDGLPTYWKQAGSATIWVSDARDLRAVEHRLWTDEAREAGTLFVDLDLSFDCDAAIAMLRERGFYLAGLIPTGRNGRDWIRLQRPQSAADLDGIRVVPEGAWLLEQVLADRASVA